MRVLKYALRFVGIFLFSAVCASYASASSHTCTRGGEQCYDVIPGEWLSGDGKLPAPPPSQTGEGYVFPSLAPGQNPIAASATYRTQLFKPNNKFPQGASFRWSDAEQHSVEIEVRRVNEEATFTVEDNPGKIQYLAQIRYLDWAAFRRMQKAFKKWLLRRSGCWLFGDREDRFFDLNSKLLDFWHDAVLKEATFSNFAQRYLNQPRGYPVLYSGDIGDARMWVTPIGPRDTLSIAWGTNNLYPFGASISTGYTRLSVGGRTELKITPTAAGLSLFPLSTVKISSLAEQSDPAKPTVLLPFPASWAGLFGKVFVPVYNQVDLYNDRLLVHLPEKPDNPFPRFLFLLSPLSYIKADSDAGVTNLVAQFATDARTDLADGEDAFQLTRRYIIIGCTQKPESCAADELKRLIDSAANASDSKHQAPPFGGYVMGIFANQTSVEVRHHVLINGRLLEESKPHLETWGDIVGEAMLKLLMANRIGGSRPQLIVTRTECSAEGVPLRRSAVRFFTTDPRVLNAATVSEGDEFNASVELSQVLR